MVVHVVVVPLARFIVCLTDSMVSSTMLRRPDRENRLSGLLACSAVAIALRICPASPSGTMKYPEVGVPGGTDVKASLAGTSPVGVGANPLVTPGVVIIAPYFTDRSSLD